MQAQRLNITLPYELARDFKRAIPVKKRSKFIARVLKENLKSTNLKAQLIKSLKANKKLYDQVAKDWAPIEVEGWPD
jgi:metal-responsive CopG/Arc/MetJ family transcriptional regulator